MKQTVILREDIVQLLLTMHSRRSWQWRPPTTRNIRTWYICNANYQKPDLGSYYV